jgi:hypothetical protein
LLAKVTSRSQISNGKYKTDSETSRTISVCDKNGAVFWKADMDIDRDGQRTDECNEDTDCCFLPDTAFHQSDGRPLNSAALPFVVVPSPSSTWDPSTGGTDSGVTYIVFKNSTISPIEDHDRAVTRGEQLARQFITNN